MKKYTYADFRNAGMAPRQALRTARICQRFADLESQGLVTLASEDEQENYFDVYGKPDAYEGKNGKRVSADQALKEMEATLERWGCVVIYTEFRLSEDDEFEHADSIGRCVYANPLDPRENWYVPDLMSAALDAYDKARAPGEHLLSLADWAQRTNPPSSAGAG